MTWLTKAAAAFLVVLAVLGAVAWISLLDRYIAASDARVRLGDHIDFEEVRIPAIVSSEQEVTVGVRFFVGNPSGIAIDIVQISYRLYMDNLTDTRSFAEKADSIFVGTGGFFPSGKGYVVGPHTSASVWGNLTVFGATQPTAFARLNLTFSGRYYPIIDADLVFRIHGTTIVDRVVGIVFSTSGGVSPRAA